jgi:hypothetical protein
VEEAVAAMVSAEVVSEEAVVAMVSPANAGSTLKSRDVYHDAGPGDDSSVNLVARRLL